MIGVKHVMWNRTRFRATVGVAVVAATGLAVLGLPSCLTQFTPNTDSAAVSSTTPRPNTGDPSTLPIPTLPPVPVIDIDLGRHDSSVDGLESPAPTVEQSPMPELAADPQAQIAAQDLVDALADTTNPDWPNIDNLAAAPLAEGLAVTDKVNAPGPVVDARVDVFGEGYAEVVVATTDNQLLRVVLTQDAEGWKATDLLDEAT